MRSKFILILFFLTSLVRAQNYYPLQVGNVRYLGGSASVILDKDTIKGKEYFKNLNGGYERVDQLGNVLRLGYDSTEYIWLKLNACENEEWEFQVSDSHGTLGCIGKLKSKNEIVQTPDTVFTKCYYYTFHYLNVIDADYAVFLAPGVGIVKDSSLDWGLGSTFVKGRVNGKRIPSKIILPQIAVSSPLNFQANIPLDAQIYFTPDFILNPRTINFSSIRLNSKKERLLSFHFDESSYYEIRMTPDEPFENDDTITVLISKEVSDYMGDGLPDDYSLTFFTEHAYIDPGIFMKDTDSKISPLEWGDFDFADYDNDGDKDLIIIGQIQKVDTVTSLKVELYNNNSGKFEKAPFELSLEQKYLSDGSIAWVDFNHDGSADFVFSETDFDKPGTQFYRNNSGNFTLAPENTLPFGPAELEWYDFNNDGYKDLAIAGTSTFNTNSIKIFKNENGTLSEYSTLAILDYQSGIHKWADFNSDGQMDIIKTGYQLKHTKFFENQKGVFSLKDININYEDWLPYRYNIDLSDVDKDGDMDLLIGSYLLIKQGDSYILRSEPFNQFQDAFVKFKDINGDGSDDLFIIGDKSDEVQRTRTYIDLYQNTGSSFILLNEVRLNKNVFLFAAQWMDLNNDNKIDLAAMTDNGFLIFYNEMDLTSVIVNKHKINFKLQQNYPNPFNPNTIIKYSLPRASKVTLKIYDLLGREIAVLINEEKPAGEYQIQFDASGYGLSSGIYFYKLEAGEYIQTKKMIYLK
ncbi:MAG TPA: FG-GAP-like repeat-containing protein [Ignavibacteriaceae bacterium]|nr:FG-GAP-like repeat-containing protein [Ignavibacteriaceae bacterium]